MEIIGQEVHQFLQHRSACRTIAFFILILLPLGGCSDQGDLGRHSPSLVSQTYTGALNKTKIFLGEDEDYDLPLTAAEDALRTRARDMQSIRYAGIVGQIIPARNGDGFLHVAAIMRDVEVDRQRFKRFGEAARKTMHIDDVRHERLAGLDALTARRQFSVATARRGENNRLIRSGGRAMRKRSRRYRQVLERLPVEYPQVPLASLQAVHEDFHEDVVRFHAEIDQHAHMQLGRPARASLK